MSLSIQIIFYTNNDVYYHTNLIISIQIHVKPLQSGNSELHVPLLNTCDVLSPTRWYPCLQSNVTNSPTAISL